MGAFPLPIIQERERGVRWALDLAICSPSPGPVGLFSFT